MSDQEILEKAVAAIETACKELRKVAERFATDGTPAANQKLMELDARLQAAVGRAIPLFSPIV